MTIIQAIILAIVVAGYTMLALLVLWRLLRNVFNVTNRFNPRYSQGIRRVRNSADSLME